MTTPETFRPSTPEAILKTPEISDILPNDLRKKAQELGIINIYGVVF